MPLPIPSFNINNSSIVPDLSRGLSPNHCGSIPGFYSTLLLNNSGYNPVVPSGGNKYITNGVKRIPASPNPPIVKKKGKEGLDRVGFVVKRNVTVKLEEANMYFFMLKMAYSN
jgi:hypothetical protein